MNLHGRSLLKETDLGAVEFRYLVSPGERPWVATAGDLG